MGNGNMNRKKHVFVWAGKTFLSFALLCSIPTPALAAAEPPPIEAKSYIILDYESGAVLNGKEEEKKLAPASMTKMMTALVILDKIRAGELHWEDEVITSKRASAINEAQINLMPNEKELLQELFIAMLVQSANDATVALAEHAAGSEETFVEWMNQKAKELGMNGTHFRSATGLDLKLYPDPPDVKGKHVMPAHDTAILVREMIRNYPEVLQYTSISKYSFRRGTPRQQNVINWNKMLPGLKYQYAGVDGMKTGHTNEAGYCFAGTAKRGDERFVTVVMGAKSETKRFTETKKLLDYAFDEYELKELVSQNKPIPGAQPLPLPNGVERTVPVLAGKPIRLAIHKGEAKDYTFQVTYKPGIKAPIKKGTVVGEAKVFYKGQEVKGFDPVPVVTATGMEEGSWIRLFFRQVGDEVKSWF